MNIKVPEQISSLFSKIDDKNVVTVFIVNLRKNQYPHKNVVTVFSKIDDKNRYYIFVGILVFVFLLDYFLLMSPQLSALKKINPEIKTVSDNIKRAQADIDKLNTYRADLENVSQKFAEAITRTMQLARQQDPIKISNTVSEFSWSRVARLLLNVYSDTILITQDNSTDYCHGQNY